jgi:ribosomal protein S18 acetylase RimI-like enzyme
MLIRPYTSGDWPQVWAVLEPVFRAGETYPVPLDIDEADARRLWTSPPKAVFVAVEGTRGTIVGTYYLRPNFDGPGSHVCNCGYVVAEAARGRGVATRMCEHSQSEAVARGYRAMQYNLVVSANERAVQLWKAMGFAIVGTLPGAFRHPALGFVDAYVMFKELAEPAGGPRSSGRQR